MPKPPSVDAPGSRMPDFDTRPEDALVDLRFASVHATGRILRWHVVARRDMTVAELLRTLVARSQVTDAPFQADCLVLVEMMNSRLFRIFEPGHKLGKFGADDTLLVYDVPLLDAAGVAPHGGAGGGGVHIVACHSRYEHDDVTEFFGDSLEETYKELIGVPLMFRAPRDVTQRRLYELVRGSFYGARARRLRAAGPGGTGEEHLDTDDRLPFTLHYCAQNRMLSTGGIELDPRSSRAASFVSSNDERGAALLVAEWPTDRKPAPWVLQQVNSQLAEPPECYLEVILGFDMGHLLRQMQELREDERGLRAEVQDLKRDLGQCVAPPAKTSDRHPEPRGHELAAAEAPSLAALCSARPCSGSGKRGDDRTSDERWGLGKSMRFAPTLKRDLKRPVHRYGDGIMFDGVISKQPAGETGYYARPQRRESLTTALANLRWT